MSDPEASCDIKKFPKPKILLIDCDEILTGNLQSKGYNAASGTFGRPYHVSQNDRFSPVIGEPRLPNLEEQDIVIVDLSPPETLLAPEGEKRVSLGTTDFWASNQRGTIDPRPRFMFAVRQACDRILAHGGVFLVFAEPPLHQKHVLAKAQELSRLYDQQPIDIDNWSFLSLLSDDYIKKSRSAGQEMQIGSNLNPISKPVERHLPDGRYSVNFQPTYRLDKESGGPFFVELAVNKFGEAVAGMVVTRDCNGGAVYLLPHVPDKTGLVSNFIESLWPKLHPNLFPYDEINSWLHHSDYEHPAVLSMVQEQEQLRNDAELAIAHIEEKIGEERHRLGYLHRVLTGSGDQLVDDVAEVLRILGFLQVKDADSELADNQNKQEDLQILDSTPVLLVEVKGLVGMPTESDTIQVIKYIPRRMKEWQRTDVAGVVVVNHQKGFPAKNRNHHHVFTPQQIEDATHHEILLVTTWELFKLARGRLKYDWPESALLPLFYSRGRIAAVPAHWAEVGEVVHFYEGKNVVSIVLTDSLCSGCTIGFSLSTRFFEQQAQELHLNKQVVSTANPGDRVGIKVSLNRRDLPEGTKCYLVTQPSKERES